jgi:hypothetical protein
LRYSLFFFGGKNLNSIKAHTIATEKPITQNEISKMLNPQRERVTESKK